MALRSNKACNLEDFHDPELRASIRAIFPHEVARFGPSFPSNFEYRKHWEVGMTALALSRGALLHDDAEVLGVGAGNEPTLFWLTNHVRRVFATDLYLEGAEWQESADASMLVEPELHWPFPWRTARLVVQHMDARYLRYEPESFDAVFSSSSLEHFGDHDDVRRAVAEMHRVLKPRGLLCLSTEVRLRGPGPGLPGALMFSERELMDLFMNTGAWLPIDAPDFSVSPETLASVQDFADSAADVRRHVAREGRLVFHRLDWTRYPQIVLRQGDLWWTSAHIAVRRT